MSERCANCGESRERHKDMHLLCPIQTFFRATPEQSSLPTAEPSARETEILKEAYLEAGGSEEFAALMPEGAIINLHVALRAITKSTDEVVEVLERVNRLLSPGSHTFDELIRDSGLACDIVRALLAKLKGQSNVGGKG